MRVTKSTYKLSPKVAGLRKGRITRVIPDQAMSIQEIVKRYVRGLPVDIVQRTPVYLDQSDYDFEKIARSDFGEKARMADEFARRADQVVAEYNEERVSEAERITSEKKARMEAPDSQAEGAGIDSLDDTMPDDTTLVPKKLRKKS